MSKEGIVLKGIRGHYVVCDKIGKIYQCKAKSSLFRQKTVVVGDIIIFEEQENNGWIIEVKQRKNKIIRYKKNKPQILFANLDQVFLLDALNNPQTNFLLNSAYAFTKENILPIVILTKMDRVTTKTKQELCNFYQSAKIEVLAHSIFDRRDKKNILLKKLANKTSLFFGQSGVGKSSLLNYLFPEMNLKTRPTQKNMLGKHTTSKTEIYKKQNNTFIADSPGIREFRLYQQDTHQFAKNFFLLAPLEKQCFYKDCLHKTEPRCAVIQAVTNKNYPLALYQHYLELLQKFT